jgi:hypothetical protein
MVDLRFLKEGREDAKIQKIKYVHLLTFTFSTFLLNHWASINHTQHKPSLEGRKFNFTFAKMKGTPFSKGKVKVHYNKKKIFPRTTKTISNLVRIVLW